MYIQERKSVAVVAVPQFLSFYITVICQQAMDDRRTSNKHIGWFHYCSVISVRTQLVSSA